MPQEIHWSAEDGGVENLPAKALMLSLWDGKDQNAMRIDLWEPEMSVDEMKKFSVIGFQTSKRGIKTCKRAYRRQHVMGAVIINLKKSEAVDYTEHAWAMEDIDFNAARNWPRSAIEPPTNCSHSPLRSVFPPTASGGIQ